MENHHKYAECTKARDWKALCKLNNVELDSFGAVKELKVLPEYLEPNEVVFALTSGIMVKTTTSNQMDFGLNTWLVVLTSDRFLFLDAAMLTSSVDTQSIRHDRVQAVSASQGWVLGKVMVDLGSRVITIDNCKKETVKVIADMANKWLKELAEKKNAAPQAHQLPVESSLDKLEKLAKLHAMGALSTEEFNAAKQKTLIDAGLISPQRASSESRIASGGENLEPAKEPNLAENCSISASRNCPVCANPAKVFAKFCGHCGTKLTANSEAGQTSMDSNPSALNRIPNVMPDKFEL